MEKEIHKIATDCWANINNSLQKDGVRFKGDGIGTAYGGWVALQEILYPRVKSLLAAQKKELLAEIREWIEKKKRPCSCYYNLQGKSAYIHIDGCSVGEYNKKIDEEYFSLLSFLDDVVK